MKPILPVIKPPKFVQAALSSVIDPKLRSPFSKLMPSYRAPNREMVVLVLFPDV